MTNNDTAERLLKAKLVALIAMHFGDKTAKAYKALFAPLPIETVEQSAEKLLTEYLGIDRAKALLLEVKKDTL